MDVIMVGPRPCRKHVDHGRHHAWAMDALFSSEQSRPWTSSCLGHGYSLPRTDQTMDVIMVGPWMLSSNHGEANVSLRPRAGQKRMQARQGLV